MTHASHSACCIPLAAFHAHRSTRCARQAAFHARRSPGCSHVLYKTYCRVSITILAVISPSLRAGPIASANAAAHPDPSSTLEQVPEEPTRAIQPMRFFRSFSGPKCPQNLFKAMLWFTPACKYYPIVSVDLRWIDIFKSRVYRLRRP